MDEADKELNNITLGHQYSKRGTKFTLYSPEASRVNLYIKKKKEFISFPLNKLKNGFFSNFINGNYINCPYYYEIDFSGKIVKCNDPFSKGVTFNSEYSAVVDDLSISRLKKYIPIQNRAPIIYETNIRDFTEDRNTNIKNKGKYLGFVEKKRKTIGGHCAGLDYLTKLGITHVQLQPITDFYGVDDINVEQSYNWGYDVMSWFALEGSYSNNPKIPMERLKEFRKVVDTLHKNNIKVVLDVVFNHIYKYETSTLETSCPNFYFRKDPLGHIVNGSGCGNEIASEKPLIRKIILDSLIYFVKTFDVDGFRFDLMGLLDIETINSAYNELSQIKPDILLYGEGWNMGNVLKFENRACIDNANKLPHISFFNDLFRDVVRGHNFNIQQKGFASGDPKYAHAFEHVLFGSCLDIAFKKRFSSPYQSINYVECHDNLTLFDKIKIATGEEDEQVLKRVKFANALTMISAGIPLFHMGQEFGQSKEENDNSYNINKINNMRWDIVDKRWEMIEFFIGHTEFRKDLGEEIIDMNSYYQNFDINIQPNNVIVVKTRQSNIPYNFIINPHEYNWSYDFQSEQSPYLTNAGIHPNNKFVISNVIVPPLSINIYTDLKKKGELK